MVEPVSLATASAAIKLIADLPDWLKWLIFLALMSTIEAIEPLRILFNGLISFIFSVTGIPITFDWLYIMTWISALVYLAISAGQARPTGSPY